MTSGCLWCWIICVKWSPKIVYEAQVERNILNFLSFFTWLFCFLLQDVRGREDIGSKSIRQRRIRIICHRRWGRGKLGDSFHHVKYALSDHPPGTKIAILYLVLRYNAKEVNTVLISSDLNEVLYKNWRFTTTESHVLFLLSLFIIKISLTQISPEILQTRT